MAYSELIKNFEKIRAYLREFYVYGFRHRTEIGDKSSRSYDNERRRVESWLGNYLEAGQDGKEKRPYLSVDSRAIAHNPFFRPFKAKSFTDGDVKLHFPIMDILIDVSDEGITLNDMLIRLMNDYGLFFEDSTVRKKLKEYADIGLVCIKKEKKKTVYTIATDEINLDSFEDALLFFSETAPVGVVGSFLLDKLEEPIDIFSFKHHHLLYALDSEILYELLKAISDEREVTIYQSESEERVIPCKIYVSTLTGRHFLFAYSVKSKTFERYRLNRITKVDIDHKVSNYMEIKQSFNDFAKHLWGVAYKNNSGKEIEHIEMVIRVNSDESFVSDRLVNEKRCGSVEKISDTDYLFMADIYSAQEVLPWARTFIGRIVSFECSNKDVENTFKSDLKLMYEMYGVQ